MNLGVWGPLGRWSAPPISDTTKPIIVVSGPNPLIIGYSETFELPEISYSEPVDVEAQVSGYVGVSAGTYIITLHGATDYNGNKANPVTLTVVREAEVVVTPEADFTTGSITIGSFNDSIEVNDPFTYPTVTAEDGDGNDVTTSVERMNQVFPSVSGTYKIIYLLVNSLGTVVDRKEIRVDVNLPQVDAPVIGEYEPVDVNAGSNITVGPGALVVLNGTSSNQSKRGVRYRWKQTKGSRVGLQQRNQLSGAQFKAPVSNLINDLEFELTEWIGVHSFTSKVIVSVDDVTPYVEGASGIKVSPNQLVTIGAKPRYFDDEISTVEWVETTSHNITLVDSDTLNPVFTVPSLADNAVISFDVTVNGTYTATVDLVVKVQPVTTFRSAIHYNWLV